MGGMDGFSTPAYKERPGRGLPNRASPILGPTGSIRGANRSNLMPALSVGQPTLP